jgi:hypothetical protein
VALSHRFLELGAQPPRVPACKPDAARNISPICRLNRIVKFVGGNDEEPSCCFVDRCILARPRCGICSIHHGGWRGQWGRDRRRAVAGPVGEIVGGTVGAAVGAGLEIPNAVITSVQGERVPSVAVQERVVVGEPLPPSVELRPVPSYSEYRYAVVNDRRVIVEPRTRKIIKIID